MGPLHIGLYSTLCASGPLNKGRSLGPWNREKGLIDKRGMVKAGIDKRGMV